MASGRTERPFPPKQISSFVPCLVAAARASASSSLRGMRSSAPMSEPPGTEPGSATSTEKMIRWEVCVAMVSQLAPSYRHSGR